MKSRFFFLGVVLLPLISSCTKKAEETTTVIRPVKVTKVELKNEIIKEFAGSVEAVNFVKLAFRVNGQIIKFPIVEGQKVKKGDLIAEIDTRDIALQYASDKAAYETAAAQLERNKRLLAKQAISQQEYEMSMSSYQRAKSSFDLSTNNMKDTKLYAPFEGSIEKKLAENYQRVMPGSGIVQLVNTDKLRIRFSMPDSYYYLLRGRKMSFSVSFDMFKDKQFKAELVEFTDISSDGTGIPVLIQIEDPTFDRNLYDVKPGFTCNVKMTSDLQELAGSSIAEIPMSAVISDPATKKAFVWVLSNDNRVTKREIEIRTPTGTNFVAVSSGLKQGETVITAGVHQITEGEIVKPLEK